MGIGRNDWNASPEQCLQVLQDKRRAVPFTCHVCFADVLIDAPRSLGKREKVVIFPAVNTVVLQVGEGALGCLNNPAIHPSVFELLRSKRLGRVPPLTDMWSRLPFRQES